MSDMWTEASRDFERESSERELEEARIDVAPLWPFLAAALSENEYVNRKGLIEDRFTALVPDLGLRKRVVASLDEDFKVLLESKTATFNVGDRVETEDGELATVVGFDGNLVELQFDGDDSPAVGGYDSSFIVLASNKKQAGKSVWSAGHNIPGYLPESEPYITEDWGSARDSLVDDLNSAADHMFDSYPDLVGEYDDAIAELQGLSPNSEWGTIVPSSDSQYDLGISYWLSQDYVDDEDFDEDSYFNTFSKKAQYGDEEESSDGDGADDSGESDEAEAEEGEASELEEAESSDAEGEGSGEDPEEEIEQEAKRVGPPKAEGGAAARKAQASIKSIAGHGDIPWTPYSSGEGSFMAWDDPGSHDRYIAEVHYLDPDVYAIPDDVLNFGWSAIYNWEVFTDLGTSQKPTGGHGYAETEALAQMMAQGFLDTIAQASGQLFSKKAADQLRNASPQAWRRLRNNMSEGELRDIANDIVQVAGGDASQIAEALINTDWESFRQAVMASRTAAERPEPWPEAACGEQDDDTFCVLDLGHDGDHIYRSRPWIENVIGPPETEAEIPEDQEDLEEGQQEDEEEDNVPEQFQSSRKVSSQRYEVAKRIVETGQHSQLPEGPLLDGWTASAMVQVYEALSAAAQAKFDSIPLDRLVSFVMSAVGKKEATRISEWIPGGRGVFDELEGNTETASFRVTDIKHVLDDAGKRAPIWKGTYEGGRFDGQEAVAAPGLEEAMMAATVGGSPPFIIAKFPLWRTMYVGESRQATRKHSRFDDIVGYTYSADQYCPEHILQAMGHDYSTAHLGRTTEDVLTTIAEMEGIDRFDERTFDSGDFPKVIFEDQVEDEYDYCAAGHPLIG